MVLITIKLVLNKVFYPRRLCRFYETISSGVWTYATLHSKLDVGKYHMLYSSKIWSQ